MILVIVLSSVAKLSSLYKFLEPVVLNPKSFKNEPSRIKDGSEVVRFNAPDESNAVTGTAEELIISTMLVSVLPLAISTCVPLIFKYSADDVVAA